MSQRDLPKSSASRYEEYKEDLLRILYKNSFRFDPECGFRLASGRMSDTYVDVKKTVLAAEGMALAGRALYEKIDDISGLDGIGGLTLGADPLAYATAMHASTTGSPLNVFIVRKEVKEHGTRLPIEGVLTEGSRVVVVDDVITTGGSTIKAIDAVEAGGFQVERVIAFMDREEGGRENIEARVKCGVDSVFTRSDLMRVKAEVKAKVEAEAEGGE